MAEKALMCPHCQGHHLPASELPREVVIVVPCPGCNELAVLFREMVVPVDKALLQSGTRRQRILHIAEIITEFIDSGVLPEAEAVLLSEDLPFLSEHEHCDEHEDEAEPSYCGEGGPNLISDAEFEQFQKVELRAIDNAASFRQIFG